MDQTETQPNYPILVADSALSVGCDDCGTITELQTVDACPDSHTASGGCCTKQVCTVYCSYVCLNCGVWNALYQDDMIENYFEGFICHKCGGASQASCKYWGNLRADCSKYCTMGCFDGKDFIIQGRLLPNQVSRFDRLCSMDRY